MSKAESIKQTQKRLVERMAEAHASGSSAIWLGVDIGGQRFLLPLVQAHEVSPWQWPLRVPHTHTWHTGVVAMRGEIQSVIDLQGFMATYGLMSTPLPLAQRITTESRLVHLHPDLGVQVVLIVDRLLGLMGAGDVITSEASSSQAAWWSQRLIGQDQTRWQELDLIELTQMETFLTISHLNQAG